MLYSCSFITAICLFPRLLYQVPPMLPALHIFHSPVAASSPPPYFSGWAFLECKSAGTQSLRGPMCSEELLLCPSSLAVAYLKDPLTSIPMFSNLQRCTSDLCFLFLTWLAYWSSFFAAYPDLLLASLTVKTPALTPACPPSWQDSSCSNLCLSYYIYCLWYHIWIHQLLLSETTLRVATWGYPEAKSKSLYRV